MGTTAKTAKCAEGEAVVGEPWVDNGVYLKKSGRNTDNHRLVYFISVAYCGFLKELHLKDYSTKNVTNTTMSILITLI